MAVGQSDEPVRVVVPAEGSVELRAADASTGKAIQDFDVLEQTDYAGNANLQQPWQGGGRGEGGKFWRHFWQHYPKTR